MHGALEEWTERVRKVGPANAVADCRKQPFPDRGTALLWGTVLLSPERSETLGCFLTA